MSLSSLIRKKNESAEFATATPATFATHKGERGRTVASVATVAVAKSPQGQTASPAKASPGDTATASRCWLIHYLDRDPVEVICCPEATHAEILELHPGAVAAEPFIQIDRQAHAPISASEETAELPKPDPFPDDRRTCNQCLNLRGRVCTVAKPGGLVSASAGYRPDPETLQRCAGYAPGADDPDKRNGRERWPGLTISTARNAK